MGLLDGGMAAVFHGVFSGVYLDAELYAPAAAFTDNGKGGGSDSSFGDPITVKAQLEQATQAMRSADSFVETDQRILVLAHGLDPITTEHEIVLSGVRWQIASVGQDPAMSYFDLHGRRKSDAS